ncbi:cytochrome P450 [Cyathus striatus]|nr:cytochrome P450 [Cyathus striatus]
MFSFILPLVAIFSLFFLVLKLFRYGRREHFLPPGPPTYPVLGNILSMPLKGFHYKYYVFTKWANQYGDVYSLKLGSKTTVILNSIDAIQHIIEKNSASTSDRPPTYVADTVTGERQPYLLLCGCFSSAWRNQRRATHEMLRAQTCQKYVPVQKAEVYQLAIELVNNPHGFMQHIHRMTLSAIISSIYGLRVPSSASSISVEFTALVESWLSLIRPGSQIPVDIFPILKYIPGPFVTWKNIARTVRRKQMSFSYSLLEMVERRLAMGDGNECFMEVMLENGGTWGLDREFINYLGLVLLDGNADTTGNTIETFILLMTANPEVFRRAQQEIDTVIGMDRVPVLEDINNLPYLIAAMLEANRMRPVIPIGVPHYTTGPVKYKNYLIPKESTLVINTWAIFHDEKVFPNPEMYNPERFLNNNEAQKTIDYMFGAGRRVCPGIHYAKNFVYLTVMTLLWGFNISKARDVTGNVINVDIDAFDERIAVEPKPFKCDIRLRSEKHGEILRSEFHASQRDIQVFEADLPDADTEYLKFLRKDYVYQE